MHKHLAPLALLTLSACGPATPAPQPAPAVVQSLPAIPSAPPPTVAEPDPALPSAPALALSIDTARLDRWIAQVLAALDPSLRSPIERELNLPSGALGQGPISAALGIDSSRPMMMGIASLDEASGALLQRARELVRSGPGSSASRGRSSNLAELMREARGDELRMVFTIPAIDPALLVSRLQTMLDGAGWSRANAVAGFEAVWMRGRHALALSTAGDRVNVDYLPGARTEARASKLLAEGRGALATALRASAPQLEGKTARMVLSPRAVAEVGLLDSLRSVHQAIEDVDSEYATQMEEQALREAGAILELSENAEGPFFDRVEVSLETDSVMPGLSGRAIAGRGWTDPGAACAPSISVKLPPSDVAVDFSNVCNRALRLPGRAGDVGYASNPYRRLIDHAGLVGGLVALPFHFAGLSQEATRVLPGVAAQAVSRFERFGWSGGTPLHRAGVFWGLLPANTDLPTASCAISLDPKGCSGKAVLTPGKISDLGGAHARLVKTGNRWVVIAARERKAIERLLVSLTKAPVAPDRLLFSPAMLRNEIPPSVFSIPFDAWRYEGAMTVESGTLDVVIRPIPVRP